ncbi:hypothetical protein KFL_001030100 [Klebsormidium nitens]|uniref:Uncharacterized protein n=1 Tax=Klebsormidium nitens TaxID=105231 RepID=A0A1Y1HU78_KLENI|nr:hypothetical protein KFL_001030100 [Klebsormidium nitens]|eukprot:GAQ82185.1 hypothetical protein KFL_001030100 [Klebsormidium nitens]
MNRSWVPGHGADDARAEAYSSSAYRSAQAAKRAQTLLSRYKIPGPSDKTTRSTFRHHDDATAPANPLAAEPIWPQLYAQRPTQRRPQTKRGRNLEDVRRGFDPASSPRLKDLAYEDGNGSSPMSTLSGVSHAGTDSPTESSKANHRYGSASGFAPKPPEEPMNSARKRGRPVRTLDAKKNGLGGDSHGRRDPLAEFAERAAAKEASTRVADRGAGGSDVMRDSIQAAGSRLGLKIMMADELGDVSGDDFAGGPVASDVDMQNVGLREPSSEEELNEARRKLDFGNVGGSPEVYEGRSSQSRQSERSGGDLFGERKSPRKFLNFGREEQEGGKEMLGATDNWNGATREKAIGGAETAWVRDRRKKAGESDVSPTGDMRKESSAMWNSRDSATPPRQKRGDVSAPVFKGVKRSSGPDVELKSSKERIMLADSLELEAADVSTSASYGGTGETDVSLSEPSKERMESGSGPGDWKPSDGGRPLLQGPSGGTGLRHVSPLRLFADEGESDREVTPRQHYVKMADSDQESQLGEGGEEKTVEKTGVNEGRSTRFVSGGHFVSTNGGGESGATGSRQWGNAGKQSSEGSLRRELNHSWESKSADELSDFEEHSADGHTSKGPLSRASEPATFQTGSVGNKVETRAAVNRSQSAERGPVLSFSAGGQRIMLASYLLDQLDDVEATSLEGVIEEPSKESESGSGYENTPEEAEGSASRRFPAKSTYVGSTEEISFRAEPTSGEVEMNENWTRRTSGELEAEGTWTQGSSRTGALGDARKVTEYDEDFEEIADEVADVDEEDEGTPSVKRVLESDPPWEKRTEARVNGTERWAGERNHLGRLVTKGSGWDRAERERVEQDGAQYGGSESRGTDFTGAETEEGERNGTTPGITTETEGFGNILFASKDACRNCGRGPQTGHNLSGLSTGLEIGGCLPVIPEKKASSSIAVQVGTLNNKGTQVEFDEERGLLWEGTTSLGLSSEPVGLLDRARANAPATAAAPAGVYAGEEASARAYGDVEPPVREPRPPAKWLTVHRSAADDLAALAMIDLFRRHLETIGSRCKRLGFPASTLGVHAHRPFVSGRTDRRVEVL